MKIICIGDSLTRGYPHEEEFSFPSLIAKNTNWETQNHGENGQSSKEILNRVAAEGLYLKGDKATILCGANDFIFGTGSVFETLGNIMQMVKLCQEGGVEPYIVSSTLCNPKDALAFWLDTDGIDYDEVNNNLIKLRELLKDAANDFGWKFIDLQEAYKECSEFVDGLHPTKAGYEFISNIIIEGLKI